MRFSDVFQEDLRAHFPPLEKWRFIHGEKYPILRWTRRLRRIEDLERSGLGNPLRRLWWIWLKRAHLADSVRLGFTIPPHAFGPGLSIAHWGTIAVEGKARIGKNCRIHQGVTIGSSKGQVPVIGDNCFIGANACVIGGVTLGNNVKIGAGAVIIHSFGDNAVLVGNPARNKAERLNSEAASASN